MQRNLYAEKLEIINQIENKTSNVTYYKTVLHTPGEVLTRMTFIFE